MDLDQYLSPGGKAVKSGNMQAVLRVRKCTLFKPQSFFNLTFNNKLVVIHLLPVRNGKHWATLDEIHNLDHIAHTVTVKP